MIVLITNELQFGEKKSQINEGNYQKSDKTLTKNYSCWRKWHLRNWRKEKTLKIESQSAHNNNEETNELGAYIYMNTEDIITLLQ